MTQEEALQIFKESNALLEGHFLLTSGRHSDRYMQCAQVLRFPDKTAALCGGIADGFKDKKIDVVIGPATGGILVSYETARCLHVPAIFAERENGAMTLRRGFTINPGDKVLVVEDVITTGGSVKEVIDLVEKQGGEIVGVGVLVDRSNGAIDFGYPLVSILSMEVKSYPAENCPLCAAGKGDVVKPGSRNLK